MRTHRFTTPRHRVAALGLVLTLLCGCGEGPGTVVGEVRYNGKPLPAGRVTFYSQPDARHAQAADIRDGTYTIQKFPPGPVVITVETFRPSQGKPVIPKGVTALPSGAGGQDAPRRWQYVPIPHSYRDRERTGLKYTVTPGQQTHDITIEDRARASR
jgi:hypothetical protein